jgi:hypothetical protein
MMNTMYVKNLSLGLKLRIQSKTYAIFRARYEIGRGPSSATGMKGYWTLQDTADTVHAESRQGEAHSSQPKQQRAQAVTSYDNLPRPLWEVGV